MNPIDILLNHKTIRTYKKQPVPPAHLATLLEVAKRTATSTGLQHYSIIRVVSQDLKKKLAEDICKQPYIQDVPEVFLFIVDAYRNQQIAIEQGYDLETASDSDRFFQGWTDASIAAQNLVAAAELAGYGTMYMGSILNDVPVLIEMFNLPKLTFPVVGVGIGIANQVPQLKPRMPREMNVFDDTYKVFKNYVEELEDYDEEMSQYYDLRNANRRVDKFTTQVVRRLEANMPKRSHLFTYIREQGFQLK